MYFHRIFIEVRLFPNKVNMHIKMTSGNMSVLLIMLVWLPSVGQSSSQDSSGPPQVFHISEEPVTADPRGDQDWIDDSFNVFKRAMTKLNGDSFPTPVHDAPDTSVDVTRASDGKWDY